MTERAPDRFWSGIDITKTLAGALAAVCAAVVGSFLGVAGTLVGAAVASIIGSLGTEIYQRSIDRGTKKLQTLAPTFIKVPAAVGTPAVEAATEEESPSHTVPVESSPGEATSAAAGPARQLRWSRIAMAAGVLFVLAIGSLTAVELLAGKSVASMVGHSTSGTTTVSSVTDRGRNADEAPAPATSEAPSEDATTPTDAPTTDPAEAPTTTEQTTGPATAPTTDAPTTDAPQPTPPADTQQNPLGGPQPDAGPGAE
jgi:hypothetical protein